MKKRRIQYKHGSSHDGNALARREQKYGGGMGSYGREKKGHGGNVTMEGSQPKYKGTPKCMPN